MGNVKRKHANVFRRTCRNNRRGEFRTPHPAWIERSGSPVVSAYAGCVGNLDERICHHPADDIANLSTGPGRGWRRAGKTKRAHAFRRSARACPVVANSANQGERDPAAIAKLIAAINAAEKANKARVLRIIIINTNVAGPTLEQEKSRTRPQPGRSVRGPLAGHGFAKEFQSNRRFASQGTELGKNRADAQHFLTGIGGRAKGNAKGVKGQGVAKKSSGHPEPRRRRGTSQPLTACLRRINVAP